MPIEKNGLRVSDLQINDLDNDGNPEIISLFSNGSGDHSAIDNNKYKSIFKITTYKDGKFTDVTKTFFPTQLNENLFYSNRQFKLIDLDSDGLIDIYPITGDNGCTTKSPQGCGYFGFQGIDSTVYFKNKKGSFELKSLGLFFTDTVSQNVYYEFKQRKINIGGYNLALGNQIVPYFVKGISKPIFITGTQKQSVEMYEGEIFNDSLKNIRNRITQNSFLNYNFRPGFVMVPCNNPKPNFNTTKFSFCAGDTLKLSVTNINKGDTLKWYYGTKSDITNTSNKSFTDSTKLFVTRTDSLGCVNSSDTISIVKYAIPAAPSLSRDTGNNLFANVNGINWYKDGTLISDTTQKIKPSTAGSYSAKTTQNGCTSALSTPYYYLVTDIINLSASEFIKLAPNPFSNQLNFDFVVKGYQKLNMEVYDIASGVKVATKQNLTPGIPIYLGQLSAGTYLIKVSSIDNKISYQFKMVKM